MLWRSSRKMAFSSKRWPNMSAAYWRSSALLLSSPTVVEVPTQISPSPGNPCRGTCSRSRSRQARQIGALRPVKGVQLVHHQIAQRARLVAPPKPPIRRADHQEVQHLVVGEQDVRRAFAQRLPIGDQMLPPHRGVRSLLALTLPRNASVSWTTLASHRAWSKARAFIG